MQNVTLRQLEALLAVVHRRSFTAAARDLHVTQPAVSMQVRELESICDLPLLERIGRSVQPTEAGEEVARCAEGVAELLQRTGERLAALRGREAGLLKLGAVSTAKYFAPSLLAAFQRDHPGVTVRFAVGNRQEMARDLAHFESDLVIMGRPPRELETVAAPFARHPLVMIAAPTHPLARRRRIPLARVASETFLIREPGSGTRAAMEQLFEERGVAFRASMEVSSNETIKQAVMAGMGISLISAHTIGLERAAGRLVLLDVVGLPVVREWFVIHLRRRQLSPIAAAFRDLLVERGASLIHAAVEPAAPGRRGGGRARRDLRA